MTQLQQFQATVAHQKPENILYYARFTPDLAVRAKKAWGLPEEFDLAEYAGPWRHALGMLDPHLLTLREPEHPAKPDFTGYFADMQIPPGSLINEIGTLLIPGSAHHFKTYVSPLRHADRFEQIESFPYPDLSGYSDRHFRQEADQAHKRGQIVQGVVGHIYENAWQIRGYEQFLMDMLVQPDWCEYILDRLTERNCLLATSAARAGADFLTTGDDVANQITLMFQIDLWRKMIKPRWAKVYAAAKAINPDIKIWYHSDGNIEPIIPELIEIGVDILNPVQPECLDPQKIKKLYGDRLVLDGTIGTQTTMPFGTAQDVRNVVKQRLATLADDGALILSPTHVLEPEVPLENIKAFLDTAKKGFGVLREN